MTICLRSKNKKFYIVLIFVLCINIVFNNQFVGAIEEVAIDINELNLVTNQQRQKVGLLPLAINDRLSEAARDKASHMIVNNYWDHYSPNGTSPWYFIEKSNYKYQVAGENLAKGYESSSQIVYGWMNSETHRKNILNDSYQDVGYAIINGYIGDEYTTLVVAMYGAPLESNVIQKTINSSVKISMVVENNDIQPDNKMLSTNLDKNSDVMVGLVKGIMTSIPVKAYQKFSDEFKMVLMICGFVILAITIKLSLFKARNKNGFLYFRYQKHPFIGSISILSSFILVAITSFGYVI